MNISLEEYHQMTRNNQGRKNQSRPRSNRFRHNRQSHSQHTNVDNRRRLHITNLNLSCNNNDLRKLFEEFGILKRCGIHYDQLGNSKGTADIEFESHEATEKALVKLNQADIKGVKLVVAYSNTTQQNKRHKRNVEQRSLTRKVVKRNQQRRLFKRRKPSNTTQSSIGKKYGWNITHLKRNSPDKVSSFKQRRFKKTMSRRQRH